MWRESFNLSNLSMKNEIESYRKYFVIHQQHLNQYWCNLFSLTTDLFSTIFFWSPCLFTLLQAGTKNLLKWKGVMFATETDDRTISEPATTTTSSEQDSSCCTTIATNPTPGTEKDFDAITTDDEGHQVREFLNFHNSTYKFFTSGKQDRLTDGNPKNRYFLSVWY